VAQVNTVGSPQELAQKNLHFGCLGMLSTTPLTIFCICPLLEIKSQKGKKIKIKIQNW
jgi:hypothetical protein